MNSIIEQMLQQHETETLTDKKNGIKEVVQEIVLCGLSRAGFFKEAAFYGGTALRIFHGLDRFSEDLDFSLMAPNPGFDLPRYLPALERELAAYGFNFKVEDRAKAIDSDIRSAFLKGNTREHMLVFYADERLARSFSGNDTIKIKFEVDTTPPAFATFERKYRLLPIPYEVNLYDMLSLFAGKLHAVICRAWKSRVKGRDLYDYVFYLSQGTPVNLRHLNARLVDSGFDGAREDMTLEEIKDILCRRFESIDYDQARQDVLPFIKNPVAVEIWSKDFFIAITDSLSARELNP
ncbi:MAG: nucleotidyl transferase AbiEii/AbiGii toxin family protein [Prevotella sp.]|nr:nucleotidyl transferase AbiEii/AbiGii toxin family protein [Prevotella sp.]